MKKIGFIDYFLDEWHANNYPALIDKFSEGEMKVCYAYAHTAAPEWAISNEAWAEKMGVALLGSIEEVIEKSDYLIVLSPDNPEMHEELCELPLKSGKRTYVDKTFAPDKETAIRIFENAEKHGTPCFSSSALRFSEELNDIDLSKIDKIYSEGPGPLDIYSIHQIEPVVRLMNARAEKIMFLGSKEHPSYMIGFEDGRIAECYHRDDEKGSFAINVVDKENKAKRYQIQSNYFTRFVQAMIAFFRSGEAPVSHEQTIDVIAIRTAVVKACETPCEWITL